MNISQTIGIKILSIICLHFKRFENFFIQHSYIFLILLPFFVNLYRVFFRVRFTITFIFPECQRLFYSVNRSTLNHFKINHLQILCCLSKYNIQCPIFDYTWESVRYFKTLWHTFLGILKTFFHQNKSFSERHFDKNESCSFFRISLSIESSESYEIGLTVSINSDFTISLQSSI